MLILGFRLLECIYLSIQILNVNVYTDYVCHVKMFVVLISLICLIFPLNILPRFCVLTSSWFMLLFSKIYHFLIIMYVPTDVTWAVHQRRAACKRLERHRWNPQCHQAEKAEEQPQSVNVNLSDYKEHIIPNKTIKIPNHECCEIENLPQG